MCFDYGLLVNDMKQISRPNNSDTELNVSMCESFLLNEMDRRAEVVVFGLPPGGEKLADG